MKIGFQGDLREILQGVCLRGGERAHAWEYGNGSVKAEGPGLALVLVARTGFEPVVSALRGRRPWPLDERATQWLGILDSNQGYLIQSQASYR